MSEPFCLRTRRLRLRSWKPNDVEDFNEACNTPEVMRWLGGVQSRSELRRDVKYFIKSEHSDGVTFWVVERLADAKFLGFSGLVRILERDCPFRGELEIGWRIRSDAWRKGYAFEAALATLEYAFDVIRAELVFSRASRGNTASRNLMEKLGLRRRARLDYRPRCEQEELAVYSIGSDAWLSRPRH